jgi:hypothetical protein
MATVETETVGSSVASTVSVQAIAIGQLAVDALCAGA